MLFIVLGSTAKNLGMVVMLVSVVIFLAYIFFRYNYNFSTLKQKIMLKRQVDKIKGRSGDNGKKNALEKNDFENTLNGETPSRSPEEKTH